MRAQRKRRRRQIVIMSILVIIILVVVLFAGARSTVDAAETDGRYKYYTHILVEKGDSLWDIAGEYISAEYGSRAVYIDEVCRINHISGEKIYAGQTLVVPYYDSEYK